MKSSAAKLKWQERVKHVELYHQGCIKSDSKHTLAQTAKDLNLSNGRTSEYLQLASFLRTHPKEMSKFELMKDAMKFVRDKKNRMRMGL